MSGRVYLVEMMPTVPNIGSQIVMPRSGLLTIGAVLRERTDHDVQILFEPFVGGLDVERLLAKPPRFLLLNGIVSTAVENGLFVEELRSRCQEEFFVVAGGEHATLFPEEARGYADVVILYEGDRTTLPVMRALEERDPGARDLELAKIDGIHFKDRNGAWHANETHSRIDAIDYRYDFDVFAGAQDVHSRFPLAQIPVQTSRGCKYSCSFCTWVSLFGKPGYVTRPIEDVLHDVEHALAVTGVHRFMVVDNLFGAEVEYTGELLEAVVRRFEGHSVRPTFTVLCRADQFVDAGPFSDAFLALMRRAGVWNVSMGLESIEDTSLQDMRKNTATHVYLQAARRLHAHGFVIAGSFICGYADDTRETILDIARFAERLDLFTIQLYCQAVFPRTPDWKRLAHRRIPAAPERYLNGHGVEIFPARILPSELQETLFETAHRFHDRSEPQKRIMRRIYGSVWRSMRDYADALRRVEQEVLLPRGLYRGDASGGVTLQEEALVRLHADQEEFDAFTREIAARFAHLRYPPGRTGAMRLLHGVTPRLAPRLALAAASSPSPGWDRARDRRTPAMTDGSTRHPG